MSDIQKVPFHFSRAERYRTIYRALPYIFSQGVRKSFRSTPQAHASTAGLTHPEFCRAVHDVYCDMFLHGYRQSTGYRVDRSTGLAVVLFAVLMYVFDDEFEKRRERHAGLAADAIIESPGVAEIWDALGTYLDAMGRGEEILQHILKNFFAANFDNYCCYVQEAERAGSFAAVKRMVEFDSGKVLSTVYDVIRLFNGHPVHRPCAEEFHDLGMAGKFLDDMADYADDVKSRSPNLLDALAAEQPREFAMARSAIAVGEPITMQWWRYHCPTTFEQYMLWTFRYYDNVKTSTLRLPLDVFLTLLGTRKFWTVSTVRASRREN
jgi:hypothetical protein